MKIERTTISVEGDLMEAAQSHCSSNGLKFSNYVERLIRANLEAEGKLPGNPTAELIAAASEVGMEHALKLLTKAVRSRRCTATA